MGVTRVGGGAGNRGERIVGKEMIGGIFVSKS